MRSDRGSIDEGYERNDGSPTPTTRSLVLVARSEDICHIRLYFSRRKENECPIAHDIRVHAVLDKKEKCKEFLEEEVDECGREQAADRLRVPIFHDQDYIPILGENTPDNPIMVWEESSAFCKFSYNLLNKNRGFIVLQKIPPQLQLFCDRSKYSMMKLKTSDDRKAPENPIFDHGANIEPIYCTGNTALPILVLTGDQPEEPDDKHTNIPFLQKEKIIHDKPLSCDEKNWKENTNQLVEEPPRKRRKGDEIKEYKCMYCPKSLTRAQTLRDHIKKFHTKASLQEQQEDENIERFDIMTSGSTVENQEQITIGHNGNSETPIMSQTHPQEAAPGVSSCTVPDYGYCTSCRKQFISGTVKCQKCRKSFCEDCLIDSTQQCFECLMFI